MVELAIRPVGPCLHSPLITRDPCGSWLASDCGLTANQFLSGVHIHSCGNDLLGFRPYDGSLGKAPSNQGLLPLSFGASLMLGMPSLRSCSVGPPPSAIHGRGRLNRHPCRFAHCAEPPLGLSRGVNRNSAARRANARPRCWMVYAFTVGAGLLAMTSVQAINASTEPPLSLASQLLQGLGTSAKDGSAVGPPSLAGQLLQAILTFVQAQKRRPRRSPFASLPELPSQTTRHPVDIRLFPRTFRTDRPAPAIIPTVIRALAIERVRLVIQHIHTHLRIPMTIAPRRRRKTRGSAR